MTICFGNGHPYTKAEVLYPSKPLTNRSVPRTSSHYCEILLTKGWYKWVSQHQTPGSLETFTEELLTRQVGYSQRTVDVWWLIHSLTDFRAKFRLATERKSSGWSFLSLHCGSKVEMLLKKGLGNSKRPIGRINSPSVHLEINLNQKPDEYLVSSPTGGPIGASRDQGDLELRWTKRIGDSNLSGSFGISINGA